MPSRSFPRVVTRFFVAAGMAILCTLPLSAEAADTLLIDGLVKQTEHLSAADLAALPHSDVHLVFQTMHGPEEATYSGVSLWGLLEKAGFIGGLDNRKTRVGHYILATGSDGYAVVLSFGEIDPDLEGKAVLIAYARDGKPLDPAKDGLRLVVPGDKFGARSVRQLVRLDVK